MKSIVTLRTRLVALTALLLMFMSMAGGIIPTRNQSAAIVPVNAFVVSSHAAGPGGTGGAKGPNDLWDTVDSSSVGNGGLNAATTDMTTVVDKAKEVAKTVTSVLTIISFVCLLFWIAKLAMSAGNPQTRKIALTGILFSGVALALFGGSWVVVSFFWNILTP